MPPTETLVTVSRGSSRTAAGPPGVTFPVYAVMASSHVACWNPLPKLAGSAGSARGQLGRLALAVVELEPGAPGAPGAEAAFRRSWQLRRGGASPFAGGSRRAGLGDAEHRSRAPTGAGEPPAPAAPTCLTCPTALDEEVADLAAPYE